MISLNVLEVKQFMAKLLTNSIFDHFILKDMEIQTFTTYHISGQLNEAFFSKEELKGREDKQSVLWSDIKPFAYTMIKGNKTPLQMKIVFQLPKNQSEHIISRLEHTVRIDDIGGMYLNIRFENNKLHLVTGCAIKTFTLDKSLEYEWDQEVKELLKQQGIVFEIE